MELKVNSLMFLLSQTGFFVGNSSRGCVNLKV